MPAKFNRPANMRKVYKTENIPEEWLQAIRKTMTRKYPVPFESWKIGTEFWMSGKHYRVTDVGSRTVTAICIDLPLAICVAGRDGPVREEMDDDPSWFNGPPYAIEEHVMDEDDLVVCYLEKPDDDQ